MSKALVWEEMTVKDIREYLEHRQSVMLPLGVVEQHGYHLPLSTDTIVAREIARRVSNRTGILAGPAVNMSFSGGQLPGTININPNVMGMLVSEILRSLALQGFRNVFIMLGHGGSENARSLDNALKLLLRDDPAFEKVMLVHAPVWKMCEGFAEGFRGNDWHAGWVETSMVMELAPDLVRMDELETDEPAILDVMRQHPDNYQYAQKPFDDECVVPRMAQRPAVKVGVMGYPERASREQGKKMVDRTVERYSELFQEMERKRSEQYEEVEWTPEPIVLL